MFQIRPGVTFARLICHATCPGLHRPSVRNLTVLTTFSSAQNSRSVIAPLMSGMPAPIRASILVQCTRWEVAAFRLFHTPDSVASVFAVLLMSILLVRGRWLG